MGVLALLGVLGLAFSLKSYDPNEPKIVFAWLVTAVIWVLLAVELLWKHESKTTEWPSFPNLFVLSRAEACPEPRRRGDERSRRPYGPGGRRGPGFRPIQTDRAVAAAWIGLAVLTLLSPYPWASRASLVDGTLLLAIYAAIRLSLNGRGREAVSRVIPLVALTAALLGTLQLLFPRWTGIAFVAPEGWAARSLAGTLGNPDYLAFWLLAALPFAGLLRRQSPLRWGWKVVEVLLLAALFATFSRAAWLGWAIQAGLTRLVDRPRLPAWRVGLAAVVAALLLLAAAPWIGAKLFRTATLQQRLVIWQGALAMAADRPLTGQGPGSFGETFPAFRPRDYRATGLTHVNDYAHDFPLHLAAVGGLPALFLFGYLILCLVRDTGKIEARHLALAGLGAQNLFSVTLCVTPLAALAAVLLALPAEGTGEPAPGVARRPGLPLLCMIVAALCLAGFGLARPQSRASELLRSGRALMDRGPASNRSGWMRTALDDLERAIQVSPMEPAPRYRAAGLMALGGDLTRSQAGYLLTEALSPGYAEVSRNRTEVYLAMGWSEAAHVQARHGYDMNRADPVNLVTCSRAFAAAGRRKEALDMALQARDLGGPTAGIEGLIRQLELP